MDKKEALAILLQNSFIISDGEKNKILHSFEALSEEQVDALGTLLSREQQAVAEKKDTLLKQAKLLMNTLELIIA